MGKPRPDPSWSRRICSGDCNALGEAFEKLRPRLTGWIRSRLGSKLRETLSLDDVLQETFARALQSVHGFRGDNEDALLAWLGAIAESFIRKTASREKRAPELFVERDVPGSGSSPSHALRKEERFTRLQASMRELTPDQRQALRLVRIEALKIQEAADRMGRTPGAVKQLLFRALRELRRRMNTTDSVHLPDRPLFVEDSSHDK